MSRKFFVILLIGVLSVFCNVLQDIEARKPRPGGNQRPIGNQRPSVRTPASPELRPTPPPRKNRTPPPSRDARPFPEKPKQGRFNQQASFNNKATGNENSHYLASSGFSGSQLPIQPQFGYNNGYYAGSNSAGYPGQYLQQPTNYNFGGYNYYLPSEQSSSKKPSILKTVKKSITKNAGNVLAEVGYRLQQG